MEERVSSQPAGYLLSRWGLLVLLAFLLLAAWYQQLVIVILLGLVLSAAGLAELWSRLCLVGVHCERVLSERRIFPGDHIELTLKLVNRKLLPLPWVQVDDEIPAEFAPDVAPAPGNRPGYGSLSKGASLLWYSQVRWRQQLYCNKRGYYPLGPLTVTSGDIFGFYPRFLTEPQVDHIIVYPRIFPVAQLEIPSQYTLGDTRAERCIFQDPTRVIGVRDYTHHDSLRHINWKATARHQELQVKVFEPTTTLKAALFVAVDSFNYDGSLHEADFELAISTAASIANYVTERSSSVGLFVNTRLADTGQPAAIQPGSGTSQLISILEALAKVTATASGPFDDFLPAQQRTLSWGTTLIVIYSRPSASLSRLLANLRDNGNKLLVFQVGNFESDNTGGQQVTSPEDLKALSKAMA